MTKSKQWRIHVDLEPPVEVRTGGRRVRFLGANLLNRVVMIEYDVDPPLKREMPFGPSLMVLHVTDDAGSDLYPTAWEDFPWPFVASGRTTTRLDRRPPATATRLHIEVHEVLATSGGGPVAAGRQCASFDLALPPGHADLRATANG